jgi:hypothetical protein
MALDGRQITNHCPLVSTNQTRRLHNFENNLTEGYTEFAAAVTSIKDIPLFIEIAHKE